MTSVSLTVSSDYGYVLLVVVATWILNNWLGMQVMKARKKYEVQYPKLYSETSHEFNCVQRAHQNTLENMSMFLAFLILGGLQFPRVSALFGVIYLTSRVVYAYGYYTGDPSKRNRGVFGYVGLIGLIINTAICAIKMLGWV